MEQRDRSPLTVTYDRQFDVAYIKLIDTPIQFGEAAIIVNATENINLDFTADNVLLGIEVIGAKRFLPSALLNRAEDITGLSASLPAELSDQHPPS